MNIGWKGITGYFLAYMLVYLLTHTSVDFVMLLKHPGKAKYPYPKSDNIPAIISFCISTILFWISIIIIPIRSLILKSDIYNSNLIPEGIESIVRLLGMIIMSIGLLVGALGRFARGDYHAHNSTKLQTRLGFAIVRHPNYFQYFCGFIGVPLISLHMFTLSLPMIGLYGYYIIACEEETRLLLEFGENYRMYQEKVGMFFPKFSNIFKIRRKNVLYRTKKCLA
jgi:protein-S-isoprenylcysteine O-methyltransferase Ste14